MILLRQGVISILFSILLIGPASAAEGFFNESFGNYQEELETAQEENKQGIFIFFHMDECPFCHRMRTTILKDPDVVRYYRKHFLNFMHDIEGSQEVVGFNGDVTTAKGLAEKTYRVRATPVMMIFDLNGNEMVRFTGPASNSQEFLWMADFALSGAYKTQRFTAYKRQRQQQ